MDELMDGITEIDGQMDLLCITFLLSCLAIHSERQVSLPPPHTYSSDIIYEEYIYYIS